ncbi:chaperonin 10-like protein [Infundibulicybe gibba]|nr:chaperonin 10-like protein [Infundibulicybe gibba]
MQALITSPNNTAEVAVINLPKLSQHEIRIKVHSVALNPVDALYVAHPVDQPGRVVGSDIAGVVDAVGEGVTRWRVGDRVAGLLQGATSGNPRPGGFAEYTILEADLAIRIPTNVSFDEAATVPLCALTAAQALFIRLEIDAPFPSPFVFKPPPKGSDTPPAILIYSAATSLGLFTLELAKTIRTPAGRHYRIFATASPKHHAKLLSLGATAVFDYRSPTWMEDVRRASGGITHAVDCISEDESTARISQTFGEGGGRVAVIRKSAWNKEGVRADVVPLYGAVWQGLGHEISYNGETTPASPEWRALTVQFFEYLSSGHPDDPTRFPISPNPVRLMPGGLQRIVQDGFKLLGSGKVVDRGVDAGESVAEAWMRPISGEKLVYRVGG